MALMKERKKRVALLASSALTLGAIFAAVVPGAATAGNGDFQYTVHPLSKQFSTGVPAAFPTPSQCVSTYGLSCFTPQEIRTAYNIPDSATGAGKSIAIVDAYGSPTIQSDLDMFDATFGLPNTTVHIYYPTGKPKTETAHKGQPLDWAGETSLDVEWSHAIAPDATINLIVASNNYGSVLNNAVKYAVDNNLGDVLSMSYGAPESGINGGGNNLQIQQAHALFQEAANKGISVFASAGDDGASFGSNIVSALYPASDPNVTGVGGTNLFTNDDGSYVGETVWNDETGCPYGCTNGAFGATGGAPSVVFPTPAYQSTPTRGVADVSYNASVYTSVLVYVGFYAPADNGFYFYGGTSSGSPQWAAIAADADQAAGHDLGQLNSQLYALAANPATYAADFHDVMVGDNAFAGPGFAAGTGYDYPTGLGSPNVAPLIASLAGQ